MKSNDLIQDTLMPFSIDYVDGGTPLATYAMRDIGVDTLFDLSEREIVFRAKLGDMSFVTRQRPDGSVTHLYFVPEYPNTNWD